MGSRSLWRSATIFLIEPSPPIHFRRTSISLLTNRSSSNSKERNIIRVRRFLSSKPTPLNCSHDESQLTSSSYQDDIDPPQEAVLKAISEVSKTDGRVGHTTNVVIGGTVTDDSTNEWITLDKKVNSYPGVRGFTAIGTGGDDFVHSMVVAVESVIQQPIPENAPLRYSVEARSIVYGKMEERFMYLAKQIEREMTSSIELLDGKVKHKLSSKGKYISVNIGPIQVVSSEQVQAVYNAMKRDDRMKYFL